MATAEMVGQVRTARGAGTSFIIAMFTIMIVFGIGIFALGAVGGPDYFDTGAMPEDRARSMAQVGPFFMRLAVVPVLMGLFGRVMIKGMARSIERSEPKGEARLDPFAWMMHVSRLVAGTWCGPVDGRSFVVQRIQRRNGPNGFLVSVDLDAHSRVAWMRRPPSGAEIDRMAGMESEDGAPYGFQSLEVSMAERPWAVSLFEAEGVRDAVRTLTEGEAVVLVVLRPGRLLVQYPHGNAKEIDEEGLRAWVSALARIAKAVESGEAPKQRLEPNSLERLADKLS